MSEGWECPRCGEVYGPSVTKCDNPDCKPVRKQKKTQVINDPVLGEITVGEALSGDALHDALYGNSINEFADGAGRKPRRGGGEGGQGGSDGSSGVW